MKHGLSLSFALRLCVLSVSLVVGCAVLPTATRAEAPPNIVLVFVDDMGQMDLGCYGSDFYRTPNIDELADQGVRFTDAYAACTVCSPTRVSLLTGWYPARTRVTDWIPGHAKHNKFEKLREPPSWQQGLKDEWVTLPEALKTAGYTSAWYGKWHAGGEPTDHGFDVADADWARNRDESQKDPKGVFSLTEQAIQFMESHDDGPVFVVISHFAVHTPVRFNKKLRDEYEQRRKPDQRQPKAGYAAMVDALDQSVGRLVDFLDSTGRSDNTLVVFYSDNGGLDSGPGKGPTENAPLREGKGWQYEGGLRVPLIVRWPERVPKGATTDVRMTTPDLLPTFARLAGVADEAMPKTLDGIDLWQVIAEGEPPAPRPLYWHYPHYHRGMPGSVILDGEHKLITRPQDGSVELYNLRQDPYEANDLAESMPDLAGELKAKLDAWLDSVDALHMEPNPNHDPAKAKRGK